MSNYSNGDYKTPYGTIHVRNPGPKSDPPYGNVETYKRDVGDVRLQAPAIRAFKAAEVKATPRRMRRKGKVLPILITGVGYRSYAYQQALYASDSSGRYANPDGSMHVEADAVDIDMRQSATRRARIQKALESEGWHYAVDGEPWHASFRVAG
jgi:hypothetical protein